MKLNRTTTPVHSQADLIAQRWDVHIRNQHKLTALCLFASLWLSHSLYLSEQVSTAAYLSLLLFLLPFSLLFGWTRLLAGHTKANSSMLTAWLSRPLGRMMEVFIAFSLLLDAVFMLCALSSLLSEMLPTFRRFTIAPVIALLSAFSQVRNRPYAIVHLGGLVFIPLLALLLCSASPALQEGNIHHFFPILCGGADTVLAGTWWMAGSIGCACITLLLPDDAQALARLRSHTRHQGSGYVFAAYLCAFITAAAYSYLLPPRELSASRSMGTRLLLPAQISSSVPGWTLYVCLLILLLFICYGAFVSRCGIFLCGRCTQKKAASDQVTLLLFLLTLPPAMFYAQSVQTWLIRLLPFRAVPYLLSLVASSLCAAAAHIRRRRCT